MTKADLIEAVQRALEVGRREATGYVDKLFEVMAAALVAGERIKVNRFGLFLPKDKKSREVRSPRTGETLLLPAHRTVSFRAAPRLKARLQQGAAPSSLARRRRF